MLPKIELPTTTVTLPISESSLVIRPLKQKDEKILLMAKEGHDQTEILSAIKQIVNNCIVTEGVNIDKIPIIDLEWLYVKLMSISTSNIVKVSYIDGEDEQTREFDVDLNKIEIIEPSQTQKKDVTVSPTVFIVLRYPLAVLYNDKTFLNSSGIEAVDSLMVSVIQDVFEGGKSTIAGASAADLKAFVGDLPVSVTNEIRDYILNLPRLEYTINYKNSLGNDRKIVLSGLNDFFTLA